MSYEVYIERSAIKDIKPIPNKDKNRIKNTLQKLKYFPRNLDVAKLIGTKNKYRIRVGKYRILIEFDGYQIIVFSILHRKKVYKK